MRHMARANPAVTATLDGRTVPLLQYEIESAPVDYIRSLEASLPDPQWSHTDSHGHTHRWARTGRGWNTERDIPTLHPEVEHVDCDGDDYCEGYDITHWHCAQCGEQVEPGFIPDVQAQTTGIPIVVGPPSATIVTDDIPDVRWRQPYDVEVCQGDNVVIRGRAYLSGREVFPGGSRLTFAVGGAP
jgi:hypothetical protein